MTDTSLFDPDTFDRQLRGGATPLALFRQALQRGQQELLRRFEAGSDAAPLVLARATLIDQLLVRAFARFIDSPDCALIAVGGYGRGELHPHSDIDILVLVPEGLSDSLRMGLEQFVTFVWDIGLQAGHSVRTLDECVNEARADVTVATNLMESRLLCGPAEKYDALQRAIGPDRLWNSREFFAAKLKEQVARHHKFFDTSYNLEPNIKEGPGGLRDIQMIGWVAKRHFGATTLYGLVAHGFLTEEEFAALDEGQKFLWNVRFGLHAIAGRREDRLLFDHQRTLARKFGYTEEGIKSAVEAFMKRYYRTVMELNRLNEMLLQLFHEAIVQGDEPATVVQLNKRFQARNGYVEVVHEGVFKRYPFALLEIFLVLAQHPQLKGVRAQTIRLIRKHRALIDDRFRADLRCRALFMELLRQPHGVTHELRRMNRYGVLAAYLPVFGNIVGQMQHDLFHHYTVDEHTLFVVRNLRRFTVPEFRHEFPLCSELIQKIPKPEILYLAGLFHDIAKGRGGDHSELGAEDARAFAEHHGLSEYDTRLLVWLVKNHLMMSTTAQRKDISDPDVVTAFATAVANQTRLDYLYLLTVADIRATNPGLWNSWRNSLLMELYLATSRAFRRGLSNPVDQREVIRETKLEAMRLLRESGPVPERLDELWASFGDDYFVRYPADRVAWHTQAILHHSGDAPLVLIQSQGQYGRGGTEIFLYTQDRDHLFVIVTTALDQLALNIVDARIISTLDGHTLDTYTVLEQDGTPIANPARLAEIVETLRQRLADMRVPPRPGVRSLSRALKHFTIPTRIVFATEPDSGRTVMEVTTTDRPGLLAQISHAMLQCGVRLKNARIATLGERVEDIFYITDLRNQPLTDPAQRERLADAIRAYLV